MQLLLIIFGLRTTLPTKKIIAIVTKSINCELTLILLDLRAVNRKE